MLAVLGGAIVVLAVSSQLTGEVGMALALAVFACGAPLAAVGMHRTYQHHEFGMCNLITMSRLALTAALAGLLVTPSQPSSAEMWLAFGIALITLALDGVDGWTARRAALVSRFGARFDMEVDSFFALVLALIAYQTGQAGIWILALGLPRYLFWIAGHVWPQLSRDLPERQSRKVICVFQIGTLVAFLVPVLPSVLLTVTAALAAMALACSFARDILLLLSADR